MAYLNIYMFIYYKKRKKFKKTEKRRLHHKRKTENFLNKKLVDSRPDFKY